MPRTYVSGWTSRTGRDTSQSTIRDTGDGQASSPSKRASKNSEPAPKTFEDIKAECLENGTLWEDTDFPAEASSMFFKKPPSAWPDIEWKRPHEICSDPQLFVGGASRMDIVQGTLGDCWLLAAIACLTSNQQLLHKVVPPDQSFETDYAGIFRFYFWQYGRWVEVLVDDRLPTNKNTNKLIYMHSIDKNEFWSALLEKAYAKVCGSYEGLIGGATTEALTDFTGGVVEKFQLGAKAPADLFKIMSKAHAKGSLMGCSINSSAETREAIQTNGLVIGHAYSVTDVRTIRVQTPKVSGVIPMVRIRNPWGGSTEWKGAWSDGSVEWSSVPADEKAQIGLVYDRDGEFWMSFRDFVKNYQVLEICFLGPDSLAEAKEAEEKKFEGKLFEGSWRPKVNAGGCPNNKATFWINPQYRVSIVDPDPDDEDNAGTILIGVMQKERRKLQREGKNNLSIGYTMYQVPPDTTGTLDKGFFDSHMFCALSTFSNAREVSTHHKLTPGDYVIVPSTFGPNEDGDFLLRIFSESGNQQMEEMDDKTGTVDIKKDEIAPKTPEDKANKEEGRQAFLNLAGEDGEIDAFELQNILNTIFTKEFEFDGFSSDMTRSMVAMIDTDFTGKIGFPEFKKLYSDLILCKRAFKAADTDNSGFFNSFEFKAVLNTLGFRISNATFNAIVMRYSDKDGHVRFDDFVACYVKLKTLFDTFNTKNAAGDGGVNFEIDEKVHMASGKRLL